MLLWFSHKQLNKANSMSETEVWQHYLLFDLYSLLYLFVPELLM